MTDQAPDTERAAIIAKLTELEIPFFKGAPTADLKAKLPAEAAPAPQAPEIVAAALPVDDGLVACEITKNGDGKVHTGQFDQTTNQDKVYAKGDVFRVAPAIAEQLEDRGYVVIRG